MSEQDLEHATKVRAERSPTVTIAYNRKNAESVGTLSADLLKKLNDKHHFNDEPGSQASRRRRNLPSRSDNSSPQRVTELPKHTGSNILAELVGSDQSHRSSSQRLSNAGPTQTIKRATIRDVLEQEPVATRFKSMRAFQLEFMSYLRPVLRDENFDDGYGEGWCFLATHVNQNEAMFRDILKERNKKEALVSEQQQQAKRVRQQLQEQFLRKIQEEKQRREQQMAVEASENLNKQLTKIKERQQKALLRAESSQRMLIEKKNSQKSISQVSSEIDEPSSNKIRQHEPFKDEQPGSNRVQSRIQAQQFKSLAELENKQLAENVSNRVDLVDKNDSKTPEKSLFHKRSLSNKQLDLKQEEIRLEENVQASLKSELAVEELKKEECTMGQSNIEQHRSSVEVIHIDPVSNSQSKPLLQVDRGVLGTDLNLKTPRTRNRAPKDEPMTFQPRFVSKYKPETNRQRSRNAQMLAQSQKTQQLRLEKLITSRLGLMQQNSTSESIFGDNTNQEESYIDCSLDSSGLKSTIRNGDRAEQISQRKQVGSQIEKFKCYASKEELKRIVKARKLQDKQLEDQFQAISISSHTKGDQQTIQQSEKRLARSELKILASNSSAYQTKHTSESEDGLKLQSSAILRRSAELLPYTGRSVGQKVLSKSPKGATLGPLRVPTYVRQHQSTRYGHLTKRYLDLVRDTSFSRNIAAFKSNDDIGSVNVQVFEQNRSTHESPRPEQSLVMPAIDIGGSSKSYRAWKC